MTSKKRSRKSTTSKYRSKLEERVADALGKTWEYEAKDSVTSYTLTFDYLPDFYRKHKGCEYLIEVKGYFRPGDIKKYTGVIKALEGESTKEIIFVFSDPHKPVRKNARLTMAKWAEKHDVMWFAANDIHSLKEYIGGL